VPFNNSTTYDFRTSTWNPVAAVYGVMNANKQIIYIGQTDDLKRRMAEHINDTRHCMHRYAPRLVSVEVINVEASRLAREKALIDEYRPPCNG
jgi:excinuclease UvrABC nuclease subunit